MAGVTLENMIGSYVYLGFVDKLVIAGFEPPGPTKLVFVRLVGVDDKGVFFEHDQFPLSNKKTGEVIFAKTNVFIPFTKISHISTFPGIDDFSEYTATESAVAFQ